MHRELDNPAFQLPEWLTESELYKFHVRQQRQYAMFTMDCSGLLLTWNAGVHELLGFSEEEWIGKHASIIFTPADRAYDVCMSEMRSAAEKGYTSDIRWHLRKDGSELFAHGNMKALRGENERLLGFSKILTDETKTKQLQDSLTESNAALEQFAYIASHDLQEPLRTVGTYAELLARGRTEKSGGKEDEYLGFVVKGVRRMSALIHDLLMYARITTEMDRPSSFSLNQDFETATTQLQTLIEETKAVVTHDPLPQVQTDQGQMVRLFQNLVGNALKYRKPDEAPIIHVSSEQSDTEWIITVADNGIGFDPKHAKEIFEPFKRLHGHDEFEGTGVGLAICRRIVEGHGGRIWADSRPGQGTRFMFSLPLQGKAPAKYTRPVTDGL